MYCVRNVTEDLYWVGSNEHRLALFENIHPIPKGVSYNAYLLLDEKSVLVDTVDWSVCRQLMDNIRYLLNGRDLDYLIINHMEPDHGASIEEILKVYPKVRLISTAKSFLLMKQFGFDVTGHDTITVKEGDIVNFGKHTFTFAMAPMVHWPEVMVSFDTTNGVLFTADAFGTFGALDGKLFNDEMNYKYELLEEARRYFTNIVGKYGTQVQTLLKKVSAFSIKMIAPLHGPVWRTDLGYYLDKHDKWSRYEAEEKGVLIVYASMYGNTEAAAYELATSLAKKGITNIKVYDVSKTHVSYLVAEAFKYSHIVLASVTYNLEIYPVMYDFLHHLKALNFQKRTFGLIENGTWAIKSGALMKDYIDENLKECLVLGEQVSINSASRDVNEVEFNSLADALVDSLNK